MGLKAVSRTIAGSADYETGTWTPTLQGTTAAGAQTYNSQDGFYRKIGDLVFAFFQINLNALGTGVNAPSGNAQIAGLPFAARDNSPADFMTFPVSFADLSQLDIDVPGGRYSVLGRVFNGSSAIRLRSSGDNVGAGSVAVTDIGPASLIIGCAVYLTD